MADITKSTNQSAGELAPNPTPTTSSVSISDEQKKAQERISSFAVGSKDKRGNTITHILARGSNYMIYDCQANNVALSLSILIDEDGTTLEDRFNNLKPEYLRVKGVLNKVSPQELSDMKVRIANLLTLGLSSTKIDREDVIARVNQEFSEIYDQINDDYKKQLKFRLTYTTTIFALTFISIMYSMIVYYFKLHWYYPEFRSLIFVCTAGSIGGFWSVQRRIREVVFEKDVPSGWWIFWYTFQGIERVCISVFGAAFIYMILKTGIILSAIGQNLQGAVLTMYYVIFGFAAGFSETFVPSLLSKLEKKEQS